MAIEIIVDSTAGMEREYCERNGVHVIPLSVVSNGEVIEEKYIEDRIDNATLDIKGTSQGQMHAFERLFERIVIQKNQAVCITIGQGFSGTYSAAKIAADMVGAGAIRVVDSMSTAGSMRILVEHAVRRRDEGWPADKIEEAANWEAAHSHVIFTTGDIKALQRSGRVGAAAAMLGGMMRIYPVIEVKNNKMNVLAKLRGENKAVDYLVSYIDKDLKGRLAVCYAKRPELARQVAQSLEEKGFAARVQVMEAGTIVAYHLGDSALGLLMVEEYPGQA